MARILFATFLALFAVSAYCADVIAPLKQNYFVKGVVTLETSASCASGPGVGVVVSEDGLYEYTINLPSPLPPSPPEGDEDVTGIAFDVTAEDVDACSIVMKKCNSSDVFTSIPFAQNVEGTVDDVMVLGIDAVHKVILVRYSVTNDDAKTFHVELAYWHTPAEKPDDPQPDPDPEPEPEPTPGPDQPDESEPVTESIESQFIALADDTTPDELVSNVYDVSAESQASLAILDTKFVVLFVSGRTVTIRVIDRTDKSILEKVILDATTASLVFDGLLYYVSHDFTLVEYFVSYTDEFFKEESAELSTDDKTNIDEAYTYILALDAGIISTPTTGNAAATLSNKVGFFSVDGLTCAQTQRVTAEGIHAICMKNGKYDIYEFVVRGNSMNVQKDVSGYTTSVLATTKGPVPAVVINDGTVFEMTSKVEDYKIEAPSLSKITVNSTGAAINASVLDVCAKKAWVVDDVAYCIAYNKDNNTYYLFSTQNATQEDALQVVLPEGGKYYGADEVMVYYSVFNDGKHNFFSMQFADKAVQELASIEGDEDLEFIFFRDSESIVYYDETTVYIVNYGEAGFANSIDFDYAVSVAWVESDLLVWVFNGDSMIAYTIGPESEFFTKKETTLSDLTPINARLLDQVMVQIASGLVDAHMGGAIEIPFTTEYGENVNQLERYYGLPILSDIIDVSEVKDGKKVQHFFSYLVDIDKKNITFAEYALNFDVLSAEREVDDISVQISRNRCVVFYTENDVDYIQACTVVSPGSKSGLSGGAIAGIAAGAAVVVAAAAAIGGVLCCKKKKQVNPE